jgi:spore coat polysaccharide biosynthesis protein SpsF
MDNGGQENILVITQARMTSTRLPGKILMEVDHIPLLQYHLERLKNPKWQVVVATTTNKEDDAVQDFCEKMKVPCYRGSEHNVLQRFFNTAQLYQPDTVVRVTSDCPLIDSNLIEAGLEVFRNENNKNAYVSNCFPRSYARGFDFEIFSMELLQDAFTNAAEPNDLEHVTPYMWKNKSGKVKLCNLQQDIDNSHLRLCVDEKDDFRLIEKLILEYRAHLMAHNEIENLLNHHPELSDINAHIEQKKN